MAGLGFKDFAVGEVLTAADVDGYLMQQSVMRFADSAARGSALGTATGTGVPLAEGMVTYLDDVNQVQVYTGTGWTTAGKVIQAVQAYVDTNQTITTTAYTDLTSATVTVTPSSTASKFVILLTASILGANDAPTVYAKFVRDSTDINEESRHDMATGDYVTFAMSYLDSPATTSSTTYKVQSRIAASPDQATWLNSSLTVLEIAS